MSNSSASRAVERAPKRALTPRGGEPLGAAPGLDAQTALTPGMVVQAAQNPSQLNRRQLLYIQRTVGNRALGRLLRAAAPQGSSAARQGDESPARLQADGVGPRGLAAAKAAAFARSHGRPAASAGPMVQRTTSHGVSVSGMRFTPAELPADGAKTSQARVRHSGRIAAGATINWSLVGPAFGTTIDANGLITAGPAITPGADKVRVKVRAEDSTNPGAHTFGFLTLWDTTFLQAKADFPVFRALSLSLDPYVLAPTFAKFALAYRPARRRMDVTLRVNFTFVNDQPGAPNWSNKSKRGFEQKFINVVQSRWSSQYRFVNVRQPQSIWKKLNPVTVRVRVRKDAATPHQNITVHKKVITAAVGGGGLGTAEFTASDVRPNRGNFPATGPAEAAALAAVTPTPILFAAGTSAVPAADQAKLQFMATYLRRIKSPRFRVTITGHHQQVVAAPGATAAQKRAATRQARRLANERADAVFKILREGRATVNHRIRRSGVGDAGAAPAAAWDRVDIASAVPAGFQNVQTTLEHEAGHMFGIDDEYVPAGHVAGTLTDHYALTMQAFGKDYADVQAKQVPDSASLMNGGDDIRPHHYVTFWDGLSQMTQAAAVPVPPFGQADWKFEGET